MTNALELKGRNRFFLEMEEEEEEVEEDEPSAITLVNYFTNYVMQPRERSIYVQLSNIKKTKFTDEKAKQSKNKKWASVKDDILNFFSTRLVTSHTKNMLKISFNIFFW